MTVQELVTSATGAVDKNATDKKNPLTNVQNVMGFLLTSVGTVLSFIGITSAEVTTTLRNEPEKAAAVALILLLGVLAAALAVVLGSQRLVVSPVNLVSLIALLLGIGALVVYGTPIKNLEGWILLLGIVVTVVGSLLFVASVLTGKDKPEPESESGEREPRGEKSRSSGFFEFLWTRSLPVQVALIAASVLLIATSMDGAMRLETESQLATEVQVAATVSASDSLATLHVRVTAAKLTNEQYVQLTVDDKSGHHIASGTLAPDVSGAVDNTLELPIKPGNYRQIIIRTSTCTITRTKTTSTVNCGDDPSGLTIFNPSPLPSPTAR